MNVSSPGGGHGGVSWTADAARPRGEGRGPGDHGPVAQPVSALAPADQSLPGAAAASASVRRPVLARTSSS